MEIRYSTGRHAKDNKPTPKVCESFTAFASAVVGGSKTIGVLSTDTKEILNQKKTRLPYFWVEMLDPAGGRNKANAGASHVVRFDIDGTTAAGWEILRELFSTYQGFAYTTASHMHPTVNSEQRWRVVLAVSRPLSPVELLCLSTTVQQDVMDTYELIAEDSVNWDSRVYNAAQVLFGPDERAEVVYFSGDAVDADSVLLRAVPAEVPPSILRDPSKVSAVGTDDKAEYLIANGHAKGELIDGIKLPIICPFEDGHTSASGETSTVYMLDGTGGFEQGKIICLHEGCKHRSQEDFLDKIGYRVADFDIVEAEGASGEYLPWPKFKRDKFDQIEGTITNVLMALRRPDLCGVQIRLDEFRNDIILTTPKGSHVQLRDEYYTKIHTTIEQKLGFKKFEEAAIKRAVRLIAFENRYDSLKDWISKLPEWDGTPRIDTFFCRHWRIDQSAYTKAVGRYWWTLLAGRALEPGIKGDMAVVLVSQQGKNKSEGIRSMAPTPEHYMELDFEKPAAERIREMRGHNVIELGEMRGMNKAGIGAVRVTISTRADRNRGLYREHYDILLRRCGFIATVNTDTPLTDSEGNRRWLPMTIPDDTDGKHIAKQIEAERDQLWAEAVRVFKQDGIAWERAETLAKTILSDYEVKDDVWVSCISEWLETEAIELGDTSGITNGQRVPLTSKDLLVEAIGFKAPQVKRGDEMRVAKIMKDLGYKKKRLLSLPGQPYHWEKRD
ncbi:virulence-associated E family protein [Yersinia pseudotuberculosis]|uniref:Virulence-associated E family protein n=1 Tax=Yersinia pseudotuberculosis serotype O:3 (strain YPIII) TaxID=502800 RepID=A0A0H3B1V6_YERPY|nr:virulence-associated E family protein [Yersinia pseudotuberculosis]AJJ58627.1 virulence-associated E family protein [Yersinia pseudotuberculosis YPIII]AYW87256.1 hypothetical protein EGX87_08700 [Yersinia pseudotuberculosis]